MSRSWKLVAGGAVALALLAPAAAGAAQPIPNDPTPGAVQAYQGAPAHPRRLAAQEPPRHPFMAPNGRSSIHDDGFQSDSYWIPGPLGRDMSVLSNAQFGDCASVTFDSRGRIVTVCVGVAGPQLLLMDPKTLDTIASMALPPRLPGSTSIFNDFAGGGYFYLDNRDRAVVPTTTRHVFVVAVGAAGFTQEHDYDLTGAVAVGDKIISALPDWSGRLWFASTRGVVGTVGPSGEVRSKQLGEGISNSFAVDDQGGVYVVTQKALYRLDAAADGSPAVSWRERYRNSGIAKPGQSDAGSGTTPTVMEGGRVSIADNDDPMNVDVNKSGHGCHRRWHSNEIAPSLVPKLSTETGLVYTYTKPRRSDDTDAWYFTALDFCNGRTVYRRLAGTGLGYNTKLSLRYRHGHHGCARGPVTATPGGADRRSIRRARFYLGKRRVASDSRSPFRRRVDRGRHRGKAHGHVVTARVRLKNGQKAALRRRFKVCARS